MDDVIIIGGSFAGLAAALLIGRARRKVTVLHTGLPRNRFAGHSHGMHGHDREPPPSPVRPPATYKAVPITGPASIGPRLPLQALRDRLIPATRGGTHRLA